MKKNNFIFTPLVLYFYHNIIQAQPVGIGTTNPNQSAILELKSTNLGFLIPRMTTADRDAIAAPIPEALLIYNTTTQCFEAYYSNSWVAFGCIGCQLPGSFSATSPSILLGTSFNAAWTSSGAAATYYLDVSTASDFSSFLTGYNNLNVGNVTTYPINNLTCNTTYYYRVRASNTCGTTASSNTITTLTGDCAGACSSQTFATVNINTGTQITAGTTQSPGQKWCYNNLAANCTTYGGLYQWASAMNLPSSALTVYVYGNGLPNCDPCGSGGVQGICPSGYHVPTDLEFSRFEYCVENFIGPTGSTPLLTFQTTTNYRGSTGTQGPGIKMKSIQYWDGTNLSGFSALSSGYYSGGTFQNIGFAAIYWLASEMTSANLAWTRTFWVSANNINRAATSKDTGLSLRCLKN